MLFIWKDPLHCVHALQLLLVHIVGLRQVLLHDFAVLVLVHGASLRPFHWFLLCFYWCMVLAWAATLFLHLYQQLFISLSWYFSISRIYWTWLLISLCAFICYWCTLLDWGRFSLPAGLYIQLSFTLTMHSQPICLHIQLSLTLIWIVTVNWAFIKSIKTSLTSSPCLDHSESI